MFTLMIISAALMFVGIYGVAYIIVGPAEANAVARWFGTRIRKLALGILRWVGRQVTDVTNRNPLATGIVAVVLLFLLYVALCGRHIW